MRGSAASLRRRFLRLLLAPLLLLFAIGGAACYAFALHYANTVYDGWLFDSAKSLALVVERGDHGVVLDLPQPAARLFVWDVADTTYYRVSGSHSGFIAGRSDFPAVPERVDDYQGARLFDGFIDGSAVRVVTLELPAARFGETVTVQVAETGTKRRKMAREILLGVLLPQIVLIGAAGLMLWFGIRGGLAPLGTLAQRLQAQDHRRPRPIAVDDVPLEVQPLTQALNDLLTRLDGAWAAQQRFVADAAHQLRTPLTSLKLNLEQALQDADGAGAALLRECARAVERVTRLSNQLLLLARAEPDALAAAPFEQLDLAELAREVGADWVPRALRRDVEISFAAPARAVPVSGNRVLLAEALNNLLDNALKYHPGGGRIAIEVSDSPRPRPRPRVRIADDGPGIPQPLRKEALKRFYRVDRSGAEGSGLGLAIVQEIVRAHRGTLTLGDGLDGRGLGVEVVLGGGEGGGISCVGATFGTGRVRLRTRASRSEVFAYALARGLCLRLLKPWVPPDGAPPTLRGATATEQSNIKSASLQPSSFPRRRESSCAELAARVGRAGCGRLPNQLQRWLSTPRSRGQPQKLR